MRVYRFEEPIESSLDSKPRRRRGRLLLVVGVIVVVVLALPTGAALYLGRDTGSNIPAGTEIDGVPVGGLTVQEARAVVRTHGNELIARGLVFVAGGNRFQIDPAEIKLRPNAAAAVATAQADSSFVERLRGRLGDTTTRSIPLTYLYNAKA